MILPATYSAALILMIASIAAFGLWANAQKLSGKWRFELFYYDFSVGMIVLALAAAFTLGEMVPKELTFSDNLLVAAKRQMAYAAAAGVVFNLANLLLVAAVSISGMAVAFPISLGLGLAISAVWSYVSNPQTSAPLLFGGVVLAVASTVVAAFAYSAYLDAQEEQKKAALQADPRVKKTPPAGQGPGRGIALSVASGVFMGLFPPLLEIAREGDSGVAPYGLGVLLAAGVLLSSLFFIPFFMAFPVNGPPIEARDYLRGTRKEHFLGLLAGMIWMIGALCSFTAASTPAAAKVPASAAYVLGQGSPLIAALCGLLIWREFKGAGFNVKMMLVVMLVLFMAGLGLISIAPLHAS